VVNFIANFLFMEGFGFYEDDYLFTLPSLDWHWADYLAHLSRDITSWPQGRPGSWILLDTFSFFIGKAGSISAYYIFAFLLTTLAAFLFYRTLKGMVSPVCALAAAIFYVLYPADTGKQIFMHQAYFPVCCMLCLCAFKAYRSKSYVAFYVLAPVTLLTYEPYFLVFFAIPFLVGGSLRLQVRRVLVNTAILAVSLFAVLLVREHMGDARAIGVLGSPSQYLYKIVTAPAIGLFTAIKLALSRPLEAALYSSPWGYLICIGVAYLLIRAFRNVARATVVTADQVEGVAPLRLILAGLAIAIVAYLYRFYPDYYPPVVNIGRLSSLHSVSALGVAVAFAGLVAFLVRHWERTTFITVGLYLALLAGFGLEIQQSQYVRSWALQKAFFSKIVELVPDAAEGDVILVNIDTGFGYSPEFDARPKTEGFPPFWMVNYPTQVLQHLVSYPTEWKQQPRIFGYWSGAKCTPVDHGVKIGTPPFWSVDEQPVLQNGRFIMLEWQGSQLLRRTSAMKFAEVELVPKPLPLMPNPPRPPGTWFKLFFGDDLSHPLWHTFGPSINYPN
jgi:hypothetical protein